MNSAKTPTGKASKGTVGIENLNGRIRLNVPRQWTGGAQKRPSLGLPWTKENVTFAESLASRMQYDYLNGQFDLSLEKYLPSKKQQLNNVVDLPGKRAEMPLLELWDKYCEYRKPSLKVTTYKIQYCRAYRKYISDAIDAVSSDDAIAIRNWLVDNRSKQVVNTILPYISHAYNWGIEQGLTSSNPYKKLVDELKQSKALSKAKQRDESGNILNEKDDENDRQAFSLNEAEIIIEAYNTSKKVSHHTSLVKFLFYTGCRSGEAVALRWKHVKQDCTVISFQDSYNCETRTTGDTKTYVSRIFRTAVNSKLHQLLKELEGKRLEPDNANELVFKSVAGKQINWKSFTHTWRGDGTKRSVINDLVEQGKVKQYLKPYATRHTFITACVNAGYPAHVIAGWVGNSADVIWNHYFDRNQKDVTPEVF